MTVKWSGLGDIIGVGVLIRPAMDHVGCELAAYNRNIGRQVHAYHAQHAFSLSSIVVTAQQVYERESNTTGNGNNSRSLKKATTGVEKADPPFTRARKPPDFSDEMGEKGQEIEKLEEYVRRSWEELKRTMRRSEIDGGKRNRRIEERKNRERKGGRRRRKIDY